MVNMMSCIPQKRPSCHTLSSIKTPMHAIAAHFRVEGDGSRTTRDIIGRTKAGRARGRQASALKLVQEAGVTLFHADVLATPGAKRFSPQCDPDRPD